MAGQPLFEVVGTLHLVVGSGSYWIGIRTQGKQEGASYEKRERDLWGVGTPEVFFGSNTPDRLSTDHYWGI